MNGTAAMAAGVLCIACSSLASADEQHDRCMAAGRTTVDYQNCGAAWIAREEAELNRVWRRVYDSIASEAVRRDLLAEQRRWVDYKSASCRLFGNRENFGSYGSAVQFPICRAEVIRARTDQLGGYRRGIAGPPPTRQR